MVQVIYSNLLFVHFWETIKFPTFYIPPLWIYKCRRGRTKECTNRWGHGHNNSAPAFLYIFGQILRGRIIAIKVVAIVNGLTPGRILRTVLLGGSCLYDVSIFIYLVPEKSGNNCISTGMAKVIKIRIDWNYDMEQAVLENADRVGVSGLIAGK